MVRGWGFVVGALGWVIAAIQMKTNPQDSVLWCVERSAFRRVIAHLSTRRLAEHDEAIRHVRDHVIHALPSPSLFPFVQRSVPSTPPFLSVDRRKSVFVS